MVLLVVYGGGGVGVYGVVVLVGWWCRGVWGGGVGVVVLVGWWC